MKKNIILSVSTAFLFVGISLNASSQVQKNNIDPTLHSTQPFYYQPEKITKQELQYYYTTGLINKKQMINDEARLATKHIHQPSSEVSEALKATFKAASLLNKNNRKAAEKELSKATALFDTAIKKDPSLKLVPIDVSMNLVESDITPHQAKEIKEKSLQLLKNDHSQEAIKLLSELKNQITINVTDLDMELYPKATKAALNELKKGKPTKEVMAVLMKGFHTMSVKQIVVPIPVLVAQNAVEAAAKLGKDKIEKTLRLLTLAQKQLELAKYEGYMTKYNTEYKTLSKKITTLKEKVEKKNILDKDYEKTISYFKELFGKIHQGNQG